MNLSAKSRFTTIMVLTASISMLVVGAIAWIEGRHSLEEAEFTHLTSIRVAKASQIEGYFRTMNDQAVLLSKDRTIISAMVQLSRGFRLLGETAVSQEYDDALEGFYTEKFIPALAENLTNGAPEYGAFKPTTQPGRYLQYHYMAHKPEGANAGGQYSFSKADDGSDYSQFHDIYHGGFREFQQRYGFYDVLLIDFDTSDIVYSVAKEVDYGTNLSSGPYRNSGIAEVVRMVQKDPQRGRAKIIDFAPYAPSYNAPASFIAAPIYNGQHIIGIIALQIPVDKIQKIMTSDGNWRKEGMGESGETYIVGDDLLMRSDSRFLLEGKEEYYKLIRGMGGNDDLIDLIDKLNTTILLQPVNTQGARAALRGEDGNFVAYDYRGLSVLSTYAKLDINGLNWGIVSEINENEAFAPIGRLLRRILLSTAIFIPIVAYLSFWLSQGFMRPVQSLVETAKNIRQKYDEEDHDAADQISFEAEGASEYQELGSQLNQIMGKVRGDMIDTRAKKREYTNLLTNALPLSVAERLRSGEELITDSAKQATAIFIQLENFRSVFDHEDMHNTMVLQEHLNIKINDAAGKHGIDLFNQIGMEYLGVCGLTMPYLNHIQRTISYAQDIFDIVDDFNTIHAANLITRIGVDVGPMFGGLQTNGIMDYDIFSDTVYIAQDAGYTGTGNAVTLSAMAKTYCEDTDIAYAWKKSKETIRVDGKEVITWDISKTHLKKRK